MENGTHAYGTAAGFIAESGILDAQLASGNLSDNFWRAVEQRDAVLVVANTPDGPRMLNWYSSEWPEIWEEGRDVWQSASDFAMGACMLIPRAIRPEWPRESYVFDFDAGAPQRRPYQAKGSTILLPIHPRHAEHILDGTKTYEFRRVAPQRVVASIVLYSTSPVMAVVGKAEVLGLVEGPKDAVWEETSATAGITRAEFDAYYRDRETALAYRLGAVAEYAVPRPLADYGIRRAPQSFTYLEGP